MCEGGFEAHLRDYRCSAVSGLQLLLQRGLKGAKPCAHQILDGVIRNQL